MGSGLTFLNWTIIFLRGDITYTTISGKTMKVDIDPIQGSTAHNFGKDHVQSSSNLCQLDLGTEKSVVYVTPVHQDDFNYIAQYNCKKIVFDCQARNKELFARMATQVPGRRILDLLDHLAGQFGTNEAKQALLDCSKLFTNYYKIPPVSSEHFIITYDDIFEHLDQRIPDLFLFLGETVDQSRLLKWLSIYHTYRENNRNILTEFATPVAVANSVKLKILNEIIKWNNGLSPHK